MVALVTVPVRVWAGVWADEAMASATMKANSADCASLVKKTPYSVDVLPDAVALRNQCLIGLVIANPEPQISVGPFKRKGAMVQGDAGGPHFMAVRSPTLLNCNEECCEFAFSNENCLSARARTSCERAWYCCQKSVVARCCIGC